MGLDVPNELQELQRAWQYRRDELMPGGVTVDPKGARGTRPPSGSVHHPALAAASRLERTPGAWEGCPNRGTCRAYAVATRRPVADGRADGGASTLLVLCGLLRYYKHGLEALRKQLLEPNPFEAFDAALLTSAHLTCTDKDRTHGECGANETDSCMDKLPPEHRLASHMATLLAPRVRLVYAQIHQQGGTSYDKPHGMYRLAHGWAALQALGLAQQYARVLVIRPDMALTAPLPLRRTCGTPGYEKAP